MLLRRRFHTLTSVIPKFEFVDLGLPSGNLWATANIGAKTPYDLGLYFAWGELIGYKASLVGVKRNFSTSEYLVTKYNSTDLKIELDIEDDAAYVIYGSNRCRIPSKADVAELFNTEYVNRSYAYGNDGIVFTSKINGNSIILPASGYAWNEHVVVKSTNYFLTRNIYLVVNQTRYNSQSGIEWDYVEGFIPYDIFPNALVSRHYGVPIRPVLYPDRTLTFKAINDGYSTIKIGLYNKRASGLLDANFEYSLDDGKTWNQYTINTLISLQKNNTIKFRGINNTLGAYQAGSTGYHYFIMTGSFEASGDVTSLLNNIGGDYDLIYSHSFYDLFKNCTALQVAPNLPSTVLSELCYCGMFVGCTNLRIAPNLPAMSMLRYCYSSMFNGCTSLILAPDLPATTLEDRCYQSMFKGCTSLLSAPILPAVNLKVGCYNYMFLNCSSLNYIKALFTTDPGLNYTNYWVDGVAETGTFVKNPDAEWDNVGANGVPVGWNITCGELKFTALLASSTIALTKVGSPANVSLLYSTDNNTWNNYTVGDVITLTNIGDSVKFRGNNTKFASSTSGYYKFVMTGQIASSGDVTSLLNNVGGDCELSSYCFYRLFYNCASLTKTPKLPSLTLAYYCYYGMFEGCTSLVTVQLLSATTLADSCCYDMFYNCTSLTTAPELPATSLAINCYKRMFCRCTSLVSIPELPATTLANGCYYSMFRDCTSLVNAPELPATTLKEDCYHEMFYNCTSLTNVPEILPATILAVLCYYHMFLNCTSLTTAPNLSATTLVDYCYFGMFDGCTSLVNAPELPATTLARSCYQNMFHGCTSLIEAPTLPATTLAVFCYQAMFNGCTSLTTAPELPATILVDCCYQNMFDGCTNLNYIKAMFTTTPSTSYTRYWVSRVSATGTFVKNSAAQWNVTGVHGVPTGWTIETATE